MAGRPDPTTEPRTPLTRERVLHAAMALADEGGLESLTMRKLARELGVEAMSLYNHVANKDDLLDGIVDMVFGEIGLPDGGVDWKTAMRQRALSAREVFARHPWAIGLLESRTTPGPATLRHLDSVLGTLREAGFSPRMAGHAFSTLDSYIYGAALQETTMPHGSSDFPEVAESFARWLPADEYPHLIETVTKFMESGYDYREQYREQYEFGLDLVLDGLEQILDAADDGGGKF
jgi:AcrR family transcriptional regulator